MKVANVLGEEREVGRVWPDGSYSCPFCGAAVLPDDAKPCPNPACEAGPCANTELVLERRHQRAEREARIEEERRRSARMAEVMRRDREREEARLRADLTQVREAGQCVECFVRSPSYKRRRVRHRTADFHAA